MITVKQLATELGVSKQAVYNRVIKEPLKSILASLEGGIVKTNQGVIYISEQGAEIIRTAYAEKYLKPGEESRKGGYGRTGKKAIEDAHKIDSVINQVEEVQSTMSDLIKQLQHKDIKIERLQDALHVKDLENAELQTRVKFINELVVGKDAVIQGLQEKYADLLSSAKLVRAQAESYKAQLMSLRGGHDPSEGDGDRAETATEGHGQTSEGETDVTQGALTSQPDQQPEMMPALDPVEEYGSFAYEGKLLEDDEVYTYSAERRSDIMQGIYDSIKRLAE